MVLALMTYCLLERNTASNHLLQNPHTFYSKNRSEVLRNAYGEVNPASWKCHHRRSRLLRHVMGAFAI